MLTEIFRVIVSGLIIICGAFNISPITTLKSWSIFGRYDNKALAFIHAASVSSEYFMVEVIDSDGNVV